MLDRILGFFGLTRVAANGQTDETADADVLHRTIASKLADLNEQLMTNERQLLDLDRQEEDLEQLGIDEDDHRWDLLAVRKSKARNLIDILSSTIVSLERQREALHAASVSEAALPREMAQQIQQQIMRAQDVIADAAEQGQEIGEDTAAIARHSRETRRSAVEDERKIRESRVASTASEERPTNTELAQAAREHETEKDQDPV